MSTATQAPATPLTQLAAWKALSAHYEKIRSQHLRDIFKSDPDRGTRLTVEAEGITYVTAAGNAPDTPCSKS